MKASFYPFSINMDKIATRGSERIANKERKIYSDLTEITDPEIQEFDEKEWRDFSMDHIRNYRKKTTSLWRKILL